MSNPTKSNAEQEYVTKHAAITLQLGELQSMIQDLPAADSERIHWGHVGNLGYVQVKIEEAARYLKSISVVNQIAKHDAANG